MRICCDGEWLGGIQGRHKTGSEGTMPLKWIRRGGSKPVAKAAFGVRWEEQIQFWSSFSVPTWDAVPVGLPSKHLQYCSLAIAVDLPYLKTHPVFSRQNCWYTKQQWFHNSPKAGDPTRQSSIPQTSRSSSFQFSHYGFRNRDHALSKLEFEWI